MTKFLSTSLALLIFTSIIGLSVPAAHAAGEKISMGMPFDGRWAYDVQTNNSCGTGSTQTAHPSCHGTNGSDLLGYHWAIDYYANDGTAVKVNASSAHGTVTFSSTTASGSCGDSLTITATVNGVNVGQMYVTHLNNSVVSSSISNGSSIGTVRNECFGVDHTHWSYKNLVSNYSCYVNYSNASYAAGMDVSNSSVIGVVGAARTGVQQTCESSDIEGAGSSNRMMIIDGSNHAYSSDILANSWTTQMNTTSVSAIAVGGSGRMMVMTSGGAVYAKDAPADSWTTQVSSGSQAIAAGGGGRMMVIDSAGNVYAKDSLTAAWTQETGNGGIQKIAVGGGGRQMLIDSAGNAYVQDGLGMSWSQQVTGANAIAVGGNGRMMVINSANNIYAKNQPSDAWQQETTLGGYVKIGVGQNGRQVMLDTSNTAYYQDGVGTSWTSLGCGTCNNIAIGSGGRIMVVDTAGKAWGKNNPGEGWTGLTSNGGASKITVNIN